MVCIAQAITRARLGYDCQLIGYPQNFAAPWAARVLMGSIWRFVPQFASKTIQQTVFWRSAGSFTFAGQSLTEPY